jgi:hypothetical protein
VSDESASSRVGVTTSADTLGFIQGFSDQTSAYPGDTVTFRVSCPNAPQFRIDFYRQGATLDYYGSTDWFAGQPAADLTDGEDWSLAWPGYAFQIPSWPTGVYVAMYVEGDGAGNPSPNQSPPIDTTTPDGPSGKSLLVVKNPAPGTSTQVLYKLPLFTYTAYNPKGGGSVYQGADVSLHRPGNGTGGAPWDNTSMRPEGPNTDCFDPTTARNSFVHFDAKMIAWLESNGYRVDYATDLDVNNDDSLSLLSPYALVLSVGHDEYYSPAMRDHLEAYVAGGGNIAFFSGNTSWWRVNFADPTAPVVFNRGPNWVGVPRPEDVLTGVSYGNAGERDFPEIGCNDPRNNTGYTVQHTEQWPFENAGIGENQTFGAALGLVGYECDGAKFNKSAARPVSPSFDDPAHPTPPGFVILGTADTSSWDSPWGNAAATMGFYTRTGTAFTGATTDWPRVLSQGDATTAQITRNVLNRLGGNSKGFAHLSSFDGIIGSDGFYSPDDGYRHAIVGTADGTVSEIFFNPNTGQGQTALAQQDGLLDVGAFYTDDDQVRHVITATSDGNIWEIYYSPAWGLGQALLGNIPGAARVSGFYTPDDGYRHAIVGTTDGAVYEIYYNPNTGISQDQLGTFPGLVDLGSFYSPDDGYRHVIVGTSDGTLTEIFFNPDYGIFQGPIANVPGLTKVSAYYVPNDRFFNRRAQVLTASGRIHEIRYSPSAGILRAVLYNRPGAVDVGAFYTPDDTMRHGIVSGSDGSVSELFFNP